MKKKPATAKRTAVAKAKPDGLAPLIAEVRNLIQSARRGVSSVIDTFQVMTNFEIGRRIVEHEQKGEKRAAYGAALLKDLSARLTQEFGKGFSPVNLSHMRRFFLTWKERIQIFQQPTEKLTATGIQQQSAVKLGASEIGQQPSDQFQNCQQPAGKLAPLAISEQPIRKSLCTLSWTHYVLLLTVKDPDERSFYEIEATNCGWSVPELKRQKASALYHRLALSRDKAGVKRLAEKGQIITKPEDVLKEPYVLEFLGLDEKADYSESDLESAIISQIERFLLELGKGFLFEARQRRFTFDEDHYFVDLVFYNRLLHCYVLVDLKLDKLTRVGAGIGEAATIDQDLDFAIYVSLGLVRPMRGFVFSDYITLWLNSPDGTDKSSRNTYGKGVSQGNLNLSLIRNFLVPLPPLAEQHRIVAKVDRLMALVDELETQLAASRTTAANLLSALIAELTSVSSSPSARSR